MVWTPFIILLLSLIISLKMYYEQSLPNFPCSSISRSTHKSEQSVSNYKRMNYFKKYLRPPKEEILEKFRQCAVKEKLLITIHSHTWKFIFVLLLLLAVLLPIDKQIRFLQQSAIHKSLFRINVATSQNPKLSVMNWLKKDFIPIVFDDQNSIGDLTGCSLVGNVVARTCRIHPIVVASSNNCDSFVDMENFTTSKSSKLYQFPNLQRHKEMYYEEIERLYLDRMKHSSIISAISTNLSFDALSIELVLFNPSISLLNSVSILFEFSGRSVFTSKKVTTLKLIDFLSPSYIIKFSLHLVLLLVALIICKNQFWTFIKKRSLHLKGVCIYFNLVFNFVLVSYLVIYFIYIIHLKNLLFELRDTNSISDVTFTDTAFFENLCQNTLAFLIFMHLMGFLELLNYSYKLKTLFKRIISASKILTAIFLFFTFFICLFDFMRRNFSDMSGQSKHPIFSCLKGIEKMFEGFQKPEIKGEKNFLDQTISFIVTYYFIAVYVYLFTLIRAILMKNKFTIKHKTNFLHVGKASKIISKKIKQFFKTDKPVIVAKENYILPVEFLLLELEELTDMLLRKSDKLFLKSDFHSESCSSNSDTVDDCMETKFEIIDDNSKLEEELNVAFFNVLSDCKLKLLSKSDANVVTEAAKRLNATMPRQNKIRGRNFLPTSLNASLASQRKFRQQDAKINLSSSLQCHKIRKTYPLYHLDSDSSSITASNSEKVPDFTLRKTKSKGKGKNKELDLYLSNNSLKGK